MASPGLRRRALLPAPAAAVLAAATPVTQAATPDSRTLVAYFTRTGNTRVLARQIRRARHAELFEIVPVDDYPEDYEQTVAQAARERQRRHLPPLRARAPALARDATVFLGFPVWGQSVPPPVRSFLAQHDLAGRTLVPFITHGGYGVGDSLAVLAADAPQARLRDDGLVLRADQERETLARVTSWLVAQP